MSSLAARRFVHPENMSFSVSTFRSKRDWTRDLMEVQEEERRRISQELHDDLGQRLALLEIRISQFELRYLPADILLGLKALRDLVGEMDRDIHRICYELYPVVLEKLGLIVGLTSLCRDFSEMSGVSTFFHHESIPKHVPKNVSLCLYRVAQEGLHNISKHAKVKEAKVSLRGTPEGVEIVVADSGNGFDPFVNRTRTGLGLVTMEERVLSVGGHCSIHSSPGLGTEVRAVVYQQGLRVLGD